MRFPSRLLRPSLLILGLASGTGILVAAPARNRARAVELVRRAAIAFQSADLPKTIALCRQATAADPSYPRSYTWLGAAFQRQGNRESACAAFRRVVNLAPIGADADRARRGIRELACDAVPPLKVTQEARWSESNGNNRIVFSGTGTQLAGAGRDGNWRVWDVPTGRLQQLRRGDGYELTSVDILGDTSVTASGSGNIRFYDLRDGRELRAVEGRQPVRDVSFSTDGKNIAVAVSDGVRILDASGGAQRDFLRTDAPALSVAYSRVGDKLAVAAGNDVRIYDAKTTQLLHTWPAGNLAVTSVAWSASGTLVAAAVGYNIKIFNTTSGRPERELRGHRLTVTTLAFGGGSILASGGYDGEVRFWDAVSGNSRGAFAAHIGPVGGLAFAPGDKRLASSDHVGNICLWKLP